MIGLSKRQQETLAQIINFNEQTGYFPSVRELCSALNVKSTNTVQSHLRALIKKGFLQRSGSQARALRLTDQALAFCEETGGPSSRAGKKPLAAVQEIVGRALGIPLLGQAPAGPLTEAVEDFQGRLQLDNILAVDESTFALTAKGDSMRDKGIHDGDWLVVRQQPDADSGDIIVALLNGEATVKTLIRRIDGLTLQPANDLYEPLRIPLDHPGFAISGKVIGVIRKL